MYYVGKVKIDTITNEIERASSDVTDRKVEDGSPIADHTSPEPVVVDLDGILVGNDYQSRFNTLKNYKNKGELITYSGVSRYKDMVIETVEKDIGKSIKNGCLISITLKEIQIGKYKTVRTNASVGKVTPKKTKAKTVKKKAPAKQTRIKKTVKAGRKTTTPKKVTTQAKNNFTKKKSKVTPASKPRIKRERYVTERGGLIEVY